MIEVTLAEDDKGCSEASARGFGYAVDGTIVPVEQFSNFLHHGDVLESDKAEETEGASEDAPEDESEEEYEDESEEEEE